MQKSLVLILFTVFLQSCFGTVAVFAQKPTNEEVLTKLLVYPILGVIDSLELGDVPIKIDLHEPTSLGNWVVKDLHRELLKRKIQVFDTIAMASDRMLFIEIERVQSDIMYQSKKRDLLYRTSKFERNINSFESFTILNELGKVLASGSNKLNFRDTLNRSDLKNIENSFHPFTMGTKLESKFIKRFLEPTLVTFSTLGVVYLFFSLRSGS